MKNIQQYMVHIHEILMIEKYVFYIVIKRLKEQQNNLPDSS